MISLKDRRSMRHKTGRQLRRLRADKGIRTTDELSLELRERFNVNIAAGLLRGLETGEAECTIDIWLILCELYNVSLDDVAVGMRGMKVAR